jgi:hypothetical protein
MWLRAFWGCGEDAGYLGFTNEGNRDRFIREYQDGDCNGVATVFRGISGGRLGHVPGAGSQKQNQLLNATSDTRFVPSKCADVESQTSVDIDG